MGAKRRRSTLSNQHTPAARKWPASRVCEIATSQNHRDMPCPAARRSSSRRFSSGRARSGVLPRRNWGSVYFAFPSNSPIMLNSGQKKSTIYHFPLAPNGFTWSCGGVMPAKRRVSHRHGMCEWQLCRQVSDRPSKRRHPNIIDDGELGRNSARMALKHLRRSAAICPRCEDVRLPRPCHDGGQSPDGCCRLMGEDGAVRRGKGRRCDALAIFLVLAHCVPLPSEKVDATEEGDELWTTRPR